MNNIWNLPRPVVQPRYIFLEKLFKDFFSDRPFSIVEIGVHRGDLLRHIAKTSLNITQYEGVDPYIGDTGDYYRGSYWADRSEATQLFEEVRKMFSSFGYKLNRETSEQFFTRTADRKFDLTYLDGDHRFSPTLWDMSRWFLRTKTDGIMCVDDYASSDHPEVTRAVNVFIEIFEPQIEAMGYRSYEMYTGEGSKRIPVSKANAFFQPKDTLNKEVWSDLIAQVDHRLRPPASQAKQSVISPVLKKVAVKD